MKRAAIILMLLLLTGCTNPFAKFYQDSSGGLDVSNSPLVVLPAGEPRIFSGTNPGVDRQRMLEEGYGLLGFSSFDARHADATDALSHAKAVHAELVLLYASVQATNSGRAPLVPLDAPASSETTSGSASGGLESASKAVNPAADDTQNKTAPETAVHYYASYWIKRSPPIFGAQVRDISPELRQSVSGKKGVVVSAVVRNSPAARADIHTADILQKIGDTDLYTAKAFPGVLEKFAGQKVAIELLRGADALRKEVQLERVTPTAP